MLVIGVASQAQHGKDTLADRLQIALGEPWQRTAFAKNVKRVYAETFGVSYEFIEEWKTNPEPPPGFTMNVRQGLQFIGDGFRKIQPQIWIDLCFRDKTPRIISDVRYPNEFLRVKQEGGLNILVGRTDKISDDPNGSEALIRPYVEYALKRFDPVCPFVDISGMNKGVWYSLLSDAPVDFQAFDVFIRNDGDKDQLYNIVDNELAQYVKNFQFE